MDLFSYLFVNFLKNFFFLVISIDDQTSLFNYRFGYYLVDFLTVLFIELVQVDTFVFTISSMIILKF